MAEKDRALALKILRLLGMGVLVTFAVALSPDFLYKALKRYLKYSLKNNYSTTQVRRSVDYLKRKKFIAFESKTGAFRLTVLGKRRLDKISIENLTIKKVPWDGKWRLVIFDVPEKHISERHIFRRRLKELGFFHFQRSVFINPYPCEKEIELLTFYLKINQYTHILIVSRFKGDKILMDKFDLKLY